MGDTLVQTDWDAVIVVGAGASVEFGFPTGAQLCKGIESITELVFSVNSRDQSVQRSGSPQLAHTFRVLGSQGVGNYSAFFDHATFIHRNMRLAPSIDNFLHTHAEIDGLADVGKMAIVDAITAAEAESTLFTTTDQMKDAILPNSIDNTWLGALFKSLATGRDFESFLEGLNRIHFVTFNYDLCIERFFRLAIPAYFRVAVTQRLWQALHVTHVYGSIDQFDFMARPVTPYTYHGRERHQVLMQNAPANIRTFTERVNEDVGLGIKHSLSSASLMVFLGFGFQPLNMKFFDLNDQYRNIRVIGTTLGVSQSNTKDIWDDVNAALKYDGVTRGSINDRVELHASTASDLIYDYARTIEKALRIHQPA